MKSLEKVHVFPKKLDMLLSKSGGNYLITLGVPFWDPGR